MAARARAAQGRRGPPFNGAPEARTQGVERLGAVEPRHHFQAFLHHVGVERGLLSALDQEHEIAPRQRFRISTARSPKYSSRPFSEGVA